ncbi:MAG: ABC transporter ATP-binding protein [Acidobacteriota bacterium]
MSFTAKQLAFAYGLKDASFELPAAGLITLAGPNGAGKSTLLGILAGIRSPYKGSVTYCGRELSQWPRRDFAQQAAYVPQTVHIDFPFTAGEIVLMGRTARTGGWYESAHDHTAAEQAMSITDCYGLRDREFRALSGGERQRVIVAAALAQEPQVLLLDEPTTHLDLRHQLSLYRLLARLGKSMLVVAVTHDLNLAMQFSDRVIVMEQGRIAGDGTPHDVLNPTSIEAVFGVRATVQLTPQGRPWMLPADVL